MTIERKKAKNINDTNNSISNDLMNQAILQEPRIKRDVDGGVRYFYIFNQPI